MFDLEGFSDTGIVHLRAAFSVDEAAAMRSAIWEYLEQHRGLDEHDPARWPMEDEPAISLKPLRGRGVFRPVVANQALREVLDAIFGPQRWRAPGRPRLLLTFPTPEPWVMPKGWHFDVGFDRPSFPVPWVQLWAFIERVDPCGGGTLLLAGSHRLVDRYRRDLPDAHQPGNGVNWSRFMKHYPALGPDPL